MIKLVYCITKKPGLTDEQFFHYWERVHGPMAARLPHLRRLVQSPRLTVPGDKFQPDYERMAALWVDDALAVLAALNIADEYQILKRKYEGVTKDMTQRTSSLENALDEVLQEARLAG